MWVDPPGGWKYGFPRIFDPASGMRLDEWLDAYQVPVEDRQWLRFWPVEEKE